MSATRAPRRQLNPFDSRLPLLAPLDVALHTGFCRETVYRALESGELRGLKKGTGPRAPWRIRVEDMEEWLSN